MYDTARIETTASHVTPYISTGTDGAISCSHCGYIITSAARMARRKSDAPNETDALALELHDCRQPAEAIERRMGHTVNGGAR